MNKSVVSVQQIKMHTNFLNSLLEDRSTPKGKIKIEMIMLSDMLSKYGEARAKANKQDLEEVYQALKKASKLIEENDIIGEYDNE